MNARCEVCPVRLLRAASLVLAALTGAHFSLAFVTSFLFGSVLISSAVSAAELQINWGPTPLADAKGPVPLKNPVVATDGAATGWVMWRASREGIPQYFVQRFDRDGNLKFPLEGVPLFKNSGYLAEAKLTLGGSQDAYAVVRSHANKKVDLILQHLNERGQRLFGPSGFTLSSGTGEARSYDIASSAKGVCVVWTERFQDEDFLYRAFIPYASASEIQGVSATQIADATGSPRDVRIFAREGKGFYLVWLEQKSRTSDWDVRMQALDPEGAPLWGDKGRPLSEATGDQRDVTGIVAEGDLFVFWTDYRNGNADIYGARVDRFGENQWDVNGSPILIGGGRQQFPEVVMGSGRSLWVVGETYHDARRTRVYQKVDFVGRALLGWEGKQVPAGVLVWEGQADTPHRMILPEVEWDQFVSLGGRNHLLTQESVENVSQLFLRRLGNDLALIGKRQQIAQAMGDVPQRSPELLPLTDGSIFLVWIDQRGGLPEIFSNVILQDGKRKWPNDLRIGPHDLHSPFQLAQGMEGYYVLSGNKVFFVDPQGVFGGPDAGVAYSSQVPTVDNVRIIASGEFAIVIWSEDGNILAQKISVDGKLGWGQTGRAVCEAEGRQRQPDARVLPNGQIVVAWEDDRLGEETTDIYAERLTVNGEPLWRPGRGMPVSTVPGIQRDVHIVLAEGEPILVWKDESGANVQVYADRMGPSGESLWQKDGWYVADFERGEFRLRAENMGEKSIILFVENREGGMRYRFLTRGGERVFGKPLQVLWAGGPSDHAVAVSEEEAIVIHGSEIQGVTESGEILFSQLSRWVSDDRTPHKIRLGSVGNQNWIVVWEELKGSDFDVYGAQFRIQ